ncbi:cell division protein FtsQ/DivIB [Flavimaricola marinus]|uniref:Cell division protein FtsQ n=1 Tax=Flavimaricola marinus TaxID=1819565 RepID=A0A238LDR5_9RHOB|nr:cell division protein FtsQ/DivIB [Flavimaricola marinus]SMY07722.1 cell division protein FtsQ [Flavimaricola marinus]
MRSLISGLRRRKPDVTAEAVAIRRDPAPTKWNYRYQRLMLTPAFRASVRIGLPAFLLVFIAGAWFSNEANRAALNDKVSELREAVQNRPEFMVTDLAVTGADVALAAAIQSRLDVEFPISSFDLELPELRNTITELTAVQDAIVRVKPGGTLEIVVTERQPVAVWRHTDGLRLIDAEGVMTGMIPSRADRPDLPLIAGDGAKDGIAEALMLFAAASPVRERIRGLVRMGERRWDLVLDNGQRIMLPTEAPITALERVIALDQAQEMLSRDVAIVDMRNGDRPTLRLNPMAAAILRPTGAGGER